MNLEEASSSMFYENEKALQFTNHLNIQKIKKTASLKFIDNKIYLLNFLWCVGKICFRELSILACQKIVLQIHFLS